MILEHISSLIEELNSAVQTKYILHKHEADRAGLHFDLRIKRLDKNTVISFALPKAEVPSGTKKVLLVTNFDHNFIWTSIKTITIPKGIYGAGEISTLQKGSMEIYKWDDKNNITFSCKGDYLNGIYHIIRANFKDSDKDNQYLFFKAKDK
jgi:hypothetical protein